MKEVKLMVHDSRPKHGCDNERKKESVLRKPEDKRPLRRLDSRWEIICVLRQILRGEVSDWI
jgi:hypothetical protein